MAHSLTAVFWYGPLFGSFSFTDSDNFPSLFCIEVDLYQFGSCIINDTLLEQFFPLFVWPLNWLDEISPIQDSRMAMDAIRAFQLHKCIRITILPNIRLAAFVLYFIQSIRFTKRNALLSNAFEAFKHSALFYFVLLPFLPVTLIVGVIPIWETGLDEVSNSLQEHSSKISYLDPTTYVECLNVITDPKCFPKPIPHTFLL